MYRWRDVQREDSLCGRGEVSACLVEFHVQVKRCTAGGGLILLVDTHVLFYCTGGEMCDGRVILYRENICIDPLVLDSFEQILARMHEG